MKVNSELLMYLLNDLIEATDTKVQYGDGCSPEDAAYAEGVADGRSEIVNQLKEILVILSIHSV